MLSVLRIVAALVYVEHGTQKMFGFPPAATPSAYHLLSQNGVAGILETFGGVALLIGLFTRPVAFVLAGEMAVAYFQVHLPRSLFPIINRGDNAVLFCFLFLYMSIAGAGTWSIDALVAARRQRSRSLEMSAGRNEMPMSASMTPAATKNAVRPAPRNPAATRSPT